jgi:hypothetical protein
MGLLGGAVSGALGLVGAVERTALRVLASCLAAAAPEPPRREIESRGAREVDARDLMAALLSRSLQTDTESGQRDFYVSLLTQLLPDEARIIAALAEGPPAPLVHVLRRASGEPVLENASMIGRTAAVTIPSLTPNYVTRLRSLGLVETGPEDPEQGLNYELLLADRAVRDALKAGEMGKVPAKVQRRTLRLSQRGRELWEASRPVGDE